MEKPNQEENKGEIKILISNQIKKDSFKEEMKDEIMNNLGQNGGQTENNIKWRSRFKLLLRTNGGEKRKNVGPMLNQMEWKEEDQLEIKMEARKKKNRKIYIGNNKSCMVQRCTALHCTVLHYRQITGEHGGL